MPRRKRSSLDPELTELVPIFVDEVRDRLERLASLASRVADDDAAQAEVKRELHTVKGAARWPSSTPVPTPSGCLRSTSAVAGRLVGS